MSVSEDQELNARAASQLCLLAGAVLMTVRTGEVKPGLLEVLKMCTALRELVPAYAEYIATMEDIAKDG